MAEPGPPPEDAQLTSDTTPTERRLHPATIFIDALRRLGSLAYFIGAALLVRYTGGESDWIDTVIAGLIGIGTGFAVLRYVSLRYRLERDRLVIRSGIVFRQVRTIPFDRIQNIDFERTLVHRALGVVDMRIETGFAGETEAQLSVLSVADANRLRSELLRRRDAAGGAATAEDTRPERTSRLVWRAALRDLVLAGATENRAGYIVAGLLGTYFTFRQLVDPVLDRASENLRPLLGGGWFTTALVTTAGALLLFLVGWVSSIVYTVARFHGFTLERDEERLRRSFGLLTQQETVLPRGRIQIMRTESPPLRRLLGRTSLFVDTAGSRRDQEPGGSATLSPLLPEAGVAGIAVEVFPDLDLRAVQWRPVSRKTIRRGAVRYGVPGLLAVAVAGASLHWQWLWAGPAVVAGALGLSFARYRAIAYAETDGFLLARGGIWTRRAWMIPKGKLQSVVVIASPFQRRLGLATLRARTAGGQLGSGAVVADLPSADAARLADRLSEAAQAAGPWLVDGV